MNDNNKKSSALFTPSDCLTGDGLMLYVSGALKDAERIKAHKHISECPLCTDAALGLRMWLKETKPDETFRMDSPGIPDSDLSGQKPFVHFHSNKSSGKSVNKFHTRTDVLNERIKQRLHSQSIIKASENKHIPYKPVVWLAAAASIIILIGSFYIVWIQNHIDKQRLDEQRAAEMAMLESAASSDTIVVVIPDGRPVLAENKKKEESVRGSFHVLADNVIEDVAVFNQDDLSTTSKREEVSEILPVEDIAAMKKEAKVASVQKVSSAASGKNAGSTISEAEDAEVLTVVEEMPSFPGGEAERNKFLSENIVYPRQAAENGIQGTVYVSFIVDIKGKIEDVKILRGIGGGCDEEALRVVKFMPPWKPGRQNSKNVRVLYNMPVYFKLQ